METTAGRRHRLHPHLHRRRRDQGAKTPRNQSSDNPEFWIFANSVFYLSGSTQEVVLSPTASSYAMSQLAASTEYSVRLQAIAGAQRSRHVDAVFMTSRDPFSFLSSLKTSFKVLAFFFHALR